MTKFLFPRFSFLHPASDPKFSFGSLALAFLTDEAISFYLDYHVVKYITN